MTQRRAAVVLIRGGDPDLSGAIAEGMMAAMAQRTHDKATSSVSAEALPPSPGGKAFGTATTADLIVRVAVHRGRGPEYWETMIAEARYNYGQPARPRGPVSRLGERLETAWALTCWVVGRMYRKQDRLLKTGS